jgi:hypothetical protein
MSNWLAKLIDKRRESMLQLRENLIIAEENWLSGKGGFSIDEVSSMMKVAVKEVLDGNRNCGTCKKRKAYNGGAF